MKNSSFQIKKNIKGVNYYGFIELEIEVKSDWRPLVTYSEYETDDQWHPVIEAGILHFSHHYYFDEKVGLSVNVRKLHTMPGDSTPAIIFYITVACLESALNYKRNIMELDENTGMFSMMR